MPVYPSVRDHGVERCEGAGYDVTTTSDLGTPPALAEPTADATALVGDNARTVVVEPPTAQQERG
jgi:hypothetical protein